MKKRHRGRGLLPLRLFFRAGRVGALPPLIIVLLIGCPAHAAEHLRPHPQTHYISLLYWPLDEPYRAEAVGGITLPTAGQIPCLWTFDARRAIR